MFWWLPKNRQKILAEADEYMESFGNRAYSEAKKAEREAWERGDKKLGKFLWRVRMEIAKRTDYSPGMDTATRYLEKPLPRVTRPKDTTLH
ncbi:MAG: hypothetical protein AB7O46_02720 [Xanthobacteraceae bacterium]